ncbi:MAG: proliferating cell nuclear antigen (pcna) [Thermoproteota archaeon]|nr:proliferating cell nuclear antigen (pcna) [Thermoproteota archaeon]
MFQITTTNPRFLKNTLTTINTLIEEATFNITPETIQLRAMDPSRVAMINLMIPKTNFDQYVCDEPTKLCINITELQKLLKGAKTNETITLKLDPKTARLQITITGNYTRAFNMPTLEAAQEEVPTPKVTFTVTAKLTTQGLNQAISDAQLVSDHVKIEADNEKLTLNAKGDLMGANIELQKGSDALLDLQTTQQAKAIYSLSYLTDIIKAASAASEIATLQFANDMPIKIDFQQQKEAKLTFYLAPRIEVE